MSSRKHAEEPSAERAAAFPGLTLHPQHDHALNAYEAAVSEASEAGMTGHELHIHGTLAAIEAVKGGK